MVMMMMMTLMMQIYVPPPDLASRKQILEIELRRKPLSSDIRLDHLADISAGFSGAEVVALCTEAAMAALKDNRECIDQQALEAAARAIKPQITVDMLNFYDSFVRTNTRNV